MAHKSQKQLLYVPMSVSSMYFLYFQVFDQFNSEVLSYNMYLHLNKLPGLDY